MQLNLTGKNLSITPAIKAHAEEKFEALSNRFNQVSNIHLVLHIEHLDHYAEATVHVHGSELHATAKSSDMYIAIDHLTEKLSNQLLKHKEKIIDSHR